MNRKKQVISAALSLLLSTGISAGSILPTFAAENDGPDATANEEQKGVAIDEKNFPDEGFRNYVKYFDENGDGYLSDDEIANVTDISIGDSCEDTPILNIKGAEIFTNVEHFYVEDNCSLETVDFSQFPQLGSLEVSNSSGLKNMDLSTCSNLVRVDLYSASDLESLNVSGCKNLRELSIDHCVKLNTVDLDSCSNLDVLGIDGTDIDSLKLDDCKDTLRILRLRNCKKLKSADITKCKKLETVDFYGCDNMEETDVEFLRKEFPGLKEMGLNSSSSQEIDLSGFKELDSFSLGDGLVESIKFDPQKKLWGIDIGHNDIKELDLEKCVETYMGNRTPEISIQRQTPTITITDDKVKDNTVKISDLFSDASRVTIKKGSGYTYDNSAKTITFKNAKNMKFNYVWDTKYEDEPLYGTANIVVEEAPKPAQPEIKISNLTKATLATTKYTYDGKDKTPAVTAYDGTTKLDNSVYTVTYPTSRKNIGTYTVKVTGKADKNCKGTVTATYQIVPKTVNTPTVKAGKKKVTVKWSNATGGVKYQLAIAKKGSAYKNYTVTGTSKTIKKLTSKKNYQIKIRAYKKVGTKTYYGGWSKIKTVKVK